MKKSIYNEPPEHEQIVERELDPLENGIRSVRIQLQSALFTAKNGVNGIVDRWIGVERLLKEKTDKYVKEPLMPATIYVGISVLAGSFLARNRNWFLRGSFPIIAGVVGASVFFPKTTTDVANDIYKCYFDGSIVDQHLSQATNVLSEAKQQTSKLLTEIVEKIKSKIPKND